jgi:hypothetical protein
MGMNGCPEWRRERTEQAQRRGQFGGAENFKTKGEQVYEPENSICSFLRTT